MILLKLGESMPGKRNWTHLYSYEINFYNILCFIKTKTKQPLVSKEYD